MHAVKIKNLFFGYTAEKTILKNINLEIPYNKFVCIVGHNGSGKSTLSKLLTGLVIPSSGEIRVCDIPLNHENMNLIINKIGLVFQNPDNQFIGITPENDIAFGLENRQVPSHVIKKIIEHISEFLKIKDILKTNATSLSGGQKQKVAIASVLATNPEIILFDESTSMLDKKDKCDIQKIMFDLVKKQNKTVISITHDMEEMLMADEVIVFKNGEMLLHAKDKSFLRDKEFLNMCNLNLPFIYEISHQLKELGINLPEFNNEEEFLKLVSEIKKESIDLSKLDKNNYLKD